MAALAKRGFKSPYLRNYVAARINPVRFHKSKKGDTERPCDRAGFTRMAAAARNSTSNPFPAKISPGSRSAQAIDAAGD